MHDAAPDPAVFTHIRIIIGMVTGLGVARLLNGLARFVQHPKREHIHGVHLGWSLFLLLSLIHFWWFEFALTGVRQWTFEEYLFVIGYAALYFFIAAVLYPDKMEDYSGFEAYFLARKKWVYGLFAGLFLADMVDTALKGMDHFRSFGPQYPIRQTLLVVFALAAMFVSDRRYHIAFVFLALISQVWWIVSAFNVLR